MAAFVHARMATHGREEGRAQDGVVPLADVRGPRFHVVEPLAEAMRSNAHGVDAVARVPGERLHAVEPLAGGLCALARVVGDLAGTLGARFHVVEPLAEALSIELGAVN